MALPLPAKVGFAQILVAQVVGSTAVVEHRISIENLHEDSVDVVHRFTLPPGASVHRVRVTDGFGQTVGTLVERGHQVGPTSFGQANHGPVEVALEAHGAFVVRIPTLCPGRGAEVSLDVVHPVGRHGAWWELPIPPRSQALVTVYGDVRRFRGQRLTAEVVDKGPWGLRAGVAHTHGGDGAVRWRSRDPAPAPRGVPPAGATGQVTALTSVVASPRSGPSCASATRTVETEVAGPSHRVEVSFEGLDITGQLVKPMGCGIICRKPIGPTVSPLIAMRRDFRDLQDAATAPLPPVEPLPIRQGRPPLMATGTVEIQDRLRRRLHRMRACGPLRAGLQVELQHLDGEVVDVLVGSDDPAVVACVAKRVRRWRVAPEVPEDLLVITP